MRELLCPVLVGRDQEWQELRRGLDRLADGLGATPVAAGEAGVGKSRLPGASPGEESRVVLGEAVLRRLAALGRGAGCVLVLENGPEQVPMRGERS